jgi:hypothetical protein
MLRRQAVLHGAAAGAAGRLQLRSGERGAPGAMVWTLDFYIAGRDYAREIMNRAGFFEADGWV